MLYSLGELEGIQMMLACVRNSWMGAPYWQKTKNKKKHCQIMVTLLVCNVPHCQFSRTFNYWHRYVLLIFKAFNSLFFSPKFKDFHCFKYSQGLYDTLRPGLWKEGRLRSHTCHELVTMCEQVLFVHVFTVIPPRLSDPRNFITVLLLC